MRQTLVVIPDTTGLPSAEVPFPCMWDLVEYLSYQRVAVIYHYFPSHFTVTFLRTDVESAQSACGVHPTSCRRRDRSRRREAGEGAGKHA